MRSALGLAIFLTTCLSQSAWAQSAYTWQQIKAKFEAVNPALKAAQLNIDESRAEETTAYLRPNPDLTGTLDQIDPFTDAKERNGAKRLPALHQRVAVWFGQLSA